MTGYTLLAEQPPVRDPDFLVKLSPQEKIGSPEQRDPYDLVSPGIYPDEKVYELDTGDLVAVSVETSWLSNGAGVSLCGYARWVEADGQSHVTFDEKEVLSEYTVTMPPELVVQHGVNALATDVARLILGEEPVLTEEIINGLNQTETHPVLKMNEIIQANISIRNQIDLVRQTEDFPQISL